MVPLRIKKVIMLVINNFTWFYQKWISKIKIKSEGGYESLKVSTFGFGIQSEATFFSSIQPSTSAERKNAPLVKH